MGSRHIGVNSISTTDWDTNPLERLIQMRDARGFLEWKMEEAVREARPTASWAQVGDALGVTRQVVWRKYAHLMDE